VGLCLICNEGYELYHKYCQRKDYTPLKNSVSSSNSLAHNALHMQQDVLGQTTTNSPGVTYSDSIIQDYVDIQINSKVGQGQPSTNNQNCWERDQSGICLLCN
jgi:hypothetical protein